MKFQDRIYLKRYQKKDDIDSILIRNLQEQYGERVRKYRFAWEKTMQMETLPRFPLEIVFDTFDGCNLNCDICTRSFFPGSSKMLEFSLFKKIMDESQIEMLPSITFGMEGEPTLNPELSEMVDYSKKKGVFDIRVGTNGQVLNPEKTIELIKRGVTRIEFSLDAATQETYSKVRKRSLDRVENCIEEILAYKKHFNLELPLIRVSFVSYEKNEDEKEMFLEKWVEKVDYVDIQDFLPIPKTKDQNQLKDVDVAPFHCPMPWQRLVIQFDGTILPCCTFFSKMLPIGNANIMTIKEGWLSEKISTLRNELKERNPNIVCKNCYGSRFRSRNNIEPLGIVKV